MDNLNSEQLDTLFNLHNTLKSYCECHDDTKITQTIVKIIKLKFHNVNIKIVAKCGSLFITVNDRGTFENEDYLSLCSELEDNYLFPNGISNIYFSYIASNVKWGNDIQLEE